VTRDAGLILSYEQRHVAVSEYGTLDGLGLAALVRARKVSPAELLEEAIARAERVNPAVNAIVRPLYDDARRAAAVPPGPSDPASAPFAGVPFLLKDLDAAVAGVPLTAGCRLLADWKPDWESTLVTRFRRVGLTIFGKTNTPELGLTPFTEPALFGPARNPWHRDHTPGGSSGGAAAAVASGIVPVAHASDGGGSIRIPASCCGLFGLKPSRGRTPVGPDRTQLWSGLAIPHAITRSVRDSAALLDAISGLEPTAPYDAPSQARPFLEEVGAPAGRLRVALTKRPHVGSRPVHADCVAAVEDAGRLAEALGHDVEEADVAIDGDAFARDFFAVVCVEIATLIARGEAAVGRRARRGELETSTVVTAMLGRQKTALALAMARERLDAAARQAVRLFERFDVLLSPTLGTPPARIGALAPQGLEAFAQEVLVACHLGFLLRVPGVVEASVRRVFSFIPFTPLANVTGQPSMSVPLAWNDQGLPVGVMFTARLGDEATLFRLAAQLESARPWRDRRPPLHADGGATPV
jgi:amidase